ncbi:MULTISPECIES: hypothetical protein [unclassified Acinetobacter]|uniref:hypothetical protein n=1 Tax=unclassified Acinetobacter TaxID=196816 RepID=UPI0035B84556
MQRQFTQLSDYPKPLKNAILIEFYHLLLQILIYLLLNNFDNIQQKDKDVMDHHIDDWAGILSELHQQENGLQENHTTNRFYIKKEIYQRTEKYHPLIAQIIIQAREQYLEKYQDKAEFKAIQFDQHCMQDVHISSIFIDYIQQAVLKQPLNEQQFHQMTKAFHHELSNDKLDAYFQQRLPNIFSIIFNDLKQISDGL